jgi:hypothetical protein
MAKHRYSADSARDPHPLLTATGRGVPPDGIAKQMASAPPPHHSGVTLNPITHS